MQPTIKMREIGEMVEITITVPNEMADEIIAAIQDYLKQIEEREKQP